jgi:hypothetical protein
MRTAVMKPVCIQVQEGAAAVCQMSLRPSAEASGPAGLQDCCCLAHGLYMEC